MIQETEHRLFQAIKKQTEKLQYFCSAENVSPNLAVHEIRKSFKRLRALLLFFPELPNNSFSYKREAIKKLGKEISSLRESHVNIQLFEKEIIGNKLISEKKIKSTREKLHEKTKLLLTELFEENEFCMRINNFANTLESDLFELGFGIISKKRMIDQVSESYLKGFLFYNSLIDLTEAEDLHRLRKMLKSLWYQLDFVKFYHPKFFRQKSDQLNKITEQLGNDHDLYALLKELKNNFYDFNLSEIEILENKIQHLRELNLSKLQPRLKQFFSEAPTIFNEKIESFF